jgi:NitT/TauT family transport system permease protein
LRLASYLTPKAEIPRHVYLAFSSVCGILAVGAWCALSYGQLVEDYFLPAPHTVLVAAYQTALDGSLAEHTAASVLVIFAGFALASVISVPLGILMGSFKLVEALIEPVTNFMRYLPVSALIPLLILWVGIGIEEKIAVIFLGTVFQQLILIADTSARVPQDLLDVSYTLGATRRQVITRVLVPATLPGVMDTLRVTMGWAWTFLVVAELVAADKGLGYMILNAMRGLFTEQIFLGILVIGLLGLVTDQSLKALRRWLLPWAHETK